MAIFLTYSIYSRFRADGPRFRAPGSRVRARLAAPTPKLKFAFR
jgi:hypothetical protein